MFGLFRSVCLAKADKQSIDGHLQVSNWGIKFRWLVSFSLVYLINRKKTVSHKVGKDDRQQQRSPRIVELFLFVTNLFHSDQKCDANDDQFADEKQKIAQRVDHSQSKRMAKNQSEGAFGRLSKAAAVDGWKRRLAKVEIDWYETDQSECRRFCWCRWPTFRSAKWPAEQIVTTPCWNVHGFVACFQETTESIKVDQSIRKHYWIQKLQSNYMDWSFLRRMPNSLTPVIISEPNANEPRWKRNSSYTLRRTGAQQAFRSLRKYQRATEEAMMKCWHA